MIELTGTGLTLEQFAAVVHGQELCDVSEKAREAMMRSREVIQRLEARAMEGEAVYGVNTGFGDLARVRIPQDQIRLLQERLVMSHAAGVGEPLPTEAVRGMLLLRANTLARGFSGVRPELVEFLLGMLNRDLLPVVPSRGSVGASGDLAPLAHLALPVIGRGRVRCEGEEMLTSEGLRRAGLAPVGLEPKEGLALINGTQAMTSLLALAVLEIRRQVRVADLVGALSTEALLGTDTPFQSRIHELRAYPGQLASAANLWNLMQGSGLRESHREDDLRVQDPYSVRCMPQVHGAVRDVLADVERRLGTEMNAVTDNPLVFAEDDEILSGGNFHGEPIAMAADFLAVATAELGSISERRIDKLTDSAFSGLPPFLTEDPGLNSGFMIGQVTAAALVSENKTLAHPASVDSIPTSAEKEDHVSMGMWAALKLG
ncbi:MAG: histidine ammonia-lyase, partial [Thermoanaerobaculia bacterium]